MKILITVVSFLISNSVLATGFTLWEIVCKHAGNPEQQPVYRIHRYSHAAPGGPIHQALTISKARVGEDDMPLVLGFRKDGELISTKDVLAITQNLVRESDEAGAEKTGYFSLYNYQNRALILDIQVPDGGELNTQGPRRDYICKRTDIDTGL